MTLTVSRSGNEVFCRMFLNWEFLKGFPIIRLGVWGFRMKTTKVSTIFNTSYQRHILSTWFITFGVELDHLGEAVFIRFLPVKLLFFPPLKRWAAIILLLEGKCLYKLYRIMHRKSALLLYLLNHSLLSAQTYLLYTLDYNEILLYFTSFQIWTLGALSVGFCVPWHPPHHCHVFFVCLFFSFSTLFFVALQDAPGSTLYVLFHSNKKA